MSKSKEQCINIINQKFRNFKNEKDLNSRLLALEETIINISDSEYASIWLFDSSTNKIKNFSKNETINLSSEDSILQTVLLSKRGFFDNYIVSHKKYNQKVDNPLNIKIKSMIIVPILDKSKGTVVAFISAFNSVHHTEELKRYDIRSLKLLENYIFDVVKLIGNEKTLLIKSSLEDKLKILKKSVPKKETVIKKIKKKEEVSVTKKNVIIKPSKQVKRKTKIELEEEIRLQKEKIIELENQLELNAKALEKREKEKKKSELTLFNPMLEEYVPERTELDSILDFLTNEVTYLADEDHKIYLFLEIIKNSLHNKDQLHFLNHELEKSQFIEKLANDLYVREKMPIVLTEFNIYQLINDISNLYSKTLTAKNMTLNIFINPQVPSSLISDSPKIKSLIIHLMNNVFNFSNEGGAIELDIEYSGVTKLLTFEIKGLRHNEAKKIKNFFNYQEISHSLTSSDNGLGLSVSSNLINIMGGKLKLTTIGKNEHSFTALIPVAQKVEEEAKKFFHKKVIKVAILMDEENSHAVQNLVKQLLSIGIDEKFILSFQSSRKMNNIKFSHLFCFENMFTSELHLKNFPSISILKYSQKELNIPSKDIKVNILHVNSYYGIEIQKIFFPNMPTVEIETNTLLVEDSFLSKFNNVVKRLKF